MTTTSAREEHSAQSLSWREAFTTAARQMAAITAAGALLGLLVGGVGGRLAMSALALLNPAAEGVTSDDTFVIGQFTLAGTLNLLVGGTVIGVLGAAVYVVVRPLVIGPRWFRLLSIGVGPAVVVGEQLVHVDGVDFTLLDPAWLAIGLFMLIPGVYAALMLVLAERWLAPDRVFARGRPLVVLTPLLLFVPIAPVLGVLALGWLGLETARRLLGGAVPGAATAAWVGRGVLVVVFCIALVRLVDEARILM